MLRAVHHRAPTGRADVLLFTLSTSADAARRDSYFGPLAAHLGEAGVMTAYFSAGREISLPSDRARVPLEAFIGPADVWAAWQRSASARLSGLPADPEFAALASSLTRAERRSGAVFMYALMRAAFTKMLVRLRPRVLVYPFENRSWEKALIREARAAGVARIVGYQHSSITPRHLAFEMCAAGPPPLPDQVICVGEVTAAWLREVAPPLATRVVAGVSLRTGSTPLPPAPEPGLLVAISSGRAEAGALIRIVHAAAARLGMPVRIRSHPTIPIDDLYAALRWPENVTLSRGTTLEQDLGAATLVAYSSSTVALEGMLHGRLPVFVDIGDIPAADPLIGDCPAKVVADSPDALVDAVRRLSAFSGEALAAERAAARRYAESYLRAPDGAALRRMVDRILDRRSA